MFYKLKKARFLLEGAPPDLKKTGPRLRINAIVEDDPPEGQTELLSPDSKFRKIKYRTDTGFIQRGWVAVDMLEEAEAATRPPVILWSFLTICVKAEEWINSQKATGHNFINADYLIALAIYESKIANIGKATPNTDATGPFQITSARWKEFISKVKDREFTDDDRENVADQIYGAAFLTRQDTAAISEAITQHDKASGENPDPKTTGPYIPTYADVFIAALAGVKAAILLRQLQIEGKNDTVITALVDGLKDSRKSEMERIFRHNHHLLKVDKAEAEAKGIAAGPRTVGNLYEVLEAKLDELLTAAYKLIEKEVPELLPVTSDHASWLEIAVQELADPWKNGTLKEKSPEGTRRVGKYFKATDLNTNKLLPWCGAFVSFCIKEIGGDIAKSVIAGSAKASNWKSWGNLSIPIGSGNIPAGAVVVMSPPPNSERSGHVGFYSPNQSGTKGKITLLGGNQSDTVRDSDYDRSKIAAIRWIGNRIGKAGGGVDSDDVPPGEGIAWGKFCTKKFNDNGAFTKKVIEISSRIQCNPSHLMAVMAFETGRSFSPKQKNLGGGSATGLIQFMPTTATELGTSTGALAKMSAIDQLDFVEKYLAGKARGRKFTLLSDIYMAVLWPKAFGKPDSSAIFTSPSKQYKANSGLDLNGNGNVTKGEAAAKVRQQLQRGLKPENRG